MTAPMLNEWGFRLDQPVLGESYVRHQAQKLSPSSFSSSHQDEAGQNSTSLQMTESAE